VVSDVFLCRFYIHPREFRPHGDSISVGDEPRGKLGFKIVGFCLFEIHNEFVGICTSPCHISGHSLPENSSSNKALHHRLNDKESHVDLRPCDGLGDGERQTGLVVSNSDVLQRGG
jgi:hypothetical protein